MSGFVRKLTHGSLKQSLTAHPEYRSLVSKTLQNRTTSSASTQTVEAVDSERTVESKRWRSRAVCDFTYTSIYRYIQICAKARACIYIYLDIDVDVGVDKDVEIYIYLYPYIYICRPRIPYTMITCPKRP